MGIELECTICIEKLESDSPEHRQAVALPCGHIYHRECIRKWIEEGRRARCCPTCKREAALGDIIRLWLPEEEEAPKSNQELERLLSRENQQKLREWLTDFNRGMQAYVIAVKDARLFALENANEKVKKLVAEMTSDAVIKEKIESALEGLRMAAKLFRDRITRLDEKAEEYEAARSSHRAKKRSLEGAQRKLSEREAQLEKARQGLQTVENGLSMRRTSLLMEECEFAEREKRIRLEIQEAQEAARASEVAAKKARVEAAQQVAAKESEARTRIELAGKEAQEARHLQAEAERERDKCKAKSNMLAEQLRSLTKQLKEAKESRLRAKARATASENLVATMKRHQGEAETPINASLAILGEPLQDRSNRRTRSPSQSEASLASPSRKTFPHFSSVDSLSTRASPGISSSASNKTHGVGAEPRPDASWLDDEDLDGELTDDDFPMPGAGVLDGRSSAQLPAHSIAQHKRLRPIVETHHRALKASGHSDQSSLREKLIPEKGPSTLKRKSTSVQETDVHNDSAGFGRFALQAIDGAQAIGPKRRFR